MGSIARKVLLEVFGFVVCAALFLGADALGRRVSIPLPPGIVGAIVLAALMTARVLPLSWIAPGGDRLLRHLGLFFVPPAVLVLRQRALLLPALAPILLVVVVSTTVGMIVAALLTERLARRDGPASEDAAAAREEEAGT